MKKPITKGYILYGFMYMKCPGKFMEIDSGCLGLGEGMEIESDC